MDFLCQLGPLALPSRLRRLADRISQDIALLYRELNVAFEPRWFPVFCLLSQKSPVGVVDIARMLGISHPAVNQIAGEMIEHGLVEASRDETDKRRRLLALTDKGREMIPVLEEAWSKIQSTLRGMLTATGFDVLGVMEKLELLVEEQGVYGRFVEAQQEIQKANIEIVEYRPEYREAFKRLNLEWIQKHFTLEPEDEKILNNPEGEIIAKGGVILFALSKAEEGQEAGEILGTCALIKQGDGAFELSKMAVTEKARGQQIGKQLLAASIEKARQLEAEQLILETSSQMSAAMSLYRKLGFVLIQEEHNPDAGYQQRSDTRMRLKL